MSIKRKFAITALCLLPIIAGAFALQDRNTRDAGALLGQVLNLVSRDFVDTVDQSELYRKAAKGLVSELKDPYTTLMEPKAAANFQIQTRGQYGGIGMEILNVQGFITVQTVFPGTPAEAGGVQEGDRILFIDTMNAQGWTEDQASTAMKGEPGTKVTVKFGRPGVATPIPVTFTRKIIHVPAVRYSMMLDGNIGYVPLTNFNETATKEVAEAVNRLQKEGAKGIVLDLRGNPGGLLPQAIGMSNLFLPNGEEIASVRGRGKSDVYTAPSEPLTTTVPITVLTDGRTASASEIVAGALQDHDRALVIGTTSFGKGLVQTIYKLDGGWELKMTTAKWYTPSGRSIQKERKIDAQGRFVEVEPDSIENEKTRKARPAFKSDSGRIVYGGGGITPDVIVQNDTLTTAEQKLMTVLAPKGPAVLGLMSNYAVELQSQIKPGFVVKKEWRDELYNRVSGLGVKVDRTLWEAGGTEIDRLLAQRIARHVYGDSTAKRLDLKDDAQLLMALELMKQASTQKELFAAAQRKTASVSNR
jgi:carboxyl-terminal processing protease